MTEQNLEEGLKAILDEVLAVNIGEIDESQMTCPSELDDLIRVATLGEIGAGAPGCGMALRFRDGSEWRISIQRSNAGENDADTNV